eukprot:COSAG06_NODE_5085_length_3733_cov_22.728949_4_plen_37_part_00
MLQLVVAVCTFDTGSSGTELLSSGFEFLVRPRALLY